MRKSSIILVGLSAALGGWALSNQRTLEAVVGRVSRTILQFYHPCRKTVTAAALKRAAKKRRNMRARSKK